MRSKNKLKENMEKPISRPIHYLGSKLRILEKLNEVIDELDPSNGCICDLFSGSGTVSNYLSKSRPVISVDIQEYSRVITSALLNKKREVIDIDRIITECIDSIYSNNMRESLKELIDYEKKVTDNAKKDNIDSLYEILDKGSIVKYISKETNNISENLDNQLAKICSKLNLEEYGNMEDNRHMILIYFGGIYFSYAQSIEIDIILEHIFKHKGVEKDILLAALLSTVSEIVNTVGKQFAQPLKVTTNSGKYKKSLLNKILQDRMLDVIPIYSSWLKKYNENSSSDFRNHIYKMDYSEALELAKDKNIKVVYADPPYTRYHYSRYYHVLETICLRDNPKLSTKFKNNKGGISRGLYREDRHQSNFCLKSKAVDEFTSLFKHVSRLNVPFVLSYSPFEEAQAVTPRLQSVTQLMDLAKKFYPIVDLITIDSIKHSKLNSVENNYKVTSAAEILIVCKFK